MTTESRKEKFKSIEGKLSNIEKEIEDLLVSDNSSGEARSNRKGAVRGTQKNLIEGPAGSEENPVSSEGGKSENHSSDIASDHQAISNSDALTPATQVEHSKPAENNDDPKTLVTPGEAGEQTVTSKPVVAENVIQNPRPSVDVNPQAVEESVTEPGTEDVSKEVAQNLETLLDPSASNTDVENKNNQPISSPDIDSKDHKPAILGLKALVSNEHEIIQQQVPAQQVIEPVKPVDPEDNGISSAVESSSIHNEPHPPGSNWYKLDLQVTLGSKKSTVQHRNTIRSSTVNLTIKHERHQQQHQQHQENQQQQKQQQSKKETTPTSTEIGPPTKSHEISAAHTEASDDKRVSLPVHKKKVVLYKSIIDSSGHLIFRYFSSFSPPFLTRIPITSLRCFFWGSTSTINWNGRKEEKIAKFLLHIKSR